MMFFGKLALLLAASCLCAASLLALVSAEAQKSVPELVDIYEGGAKPSQRSNVLSLIKKWEKTASDEREKAAEPKVRAKARLASRVEEPTTTEESVKLDEQQVEDLKPEIDQLAQRLERSNTMKLEESRESIGEDHEDNLHLDKLFE